MVTRTASAAGGIRPAAGELSWVELGELAPRGRFEGAVGHEQAGQRPAVIVSTDTFHALPPRLCVVVPLSTRRRGVPLHVEVTPADGDVPQVSFALCEGVRSVSHQRLQRRMGRVSAVVLASIQQRLRLILDL